MEMCSKDLTTREPHAGISSIFFGEQHTVLYPDLSHCTYLGCNNQ